MKSFNFKGQYNVTLGATERVDGLSKNCRMAVAACFTENIYKAMKAGDMERADSLYERNKAFNALHERLVADSKYKQDDDKAMTIGQLGLTELPVYKCDFESLPYRERYEILKKWAEGINAELEKASK